MRKATIGGVAAIVIAPIALLATSPAAHAWACADLVQPRNALTCNNMGPEWQQQYLNEIAASDPGQLKGGTPKEGLTNQDPLAPAP
jgi:hypothetical protein